MRVRCVVVLVLVHTALASIAFTKKDSSTALTTITKHELNATEALPSKNEIKITKLKISRRRNKKSRSTSSSSGEKGNKDSDSADRSSLDIQSSDDGSESKRKRHRSLEGTGWRKWHRKCTPCPEEMAKKWRDASIRWICGGFQRARRSFKSECLMYYRNCQDGTMFVKLHDHRCSDTPIGNYSRGRHWFYDYKVVLSADSTDSDLDSSDSSQLKSSDSASADNLSLGAV